MKSHALRLCITLRVGLALTLLLPACSALADVSARVSQSQVRLNDAFELILESTGEKGSAPDLSGLRKKFDVVSQATSQSIRVVNGQRSSRSEVRLTLMAREAGDLAIPAISFGAERTEPIPLKVLEPSAEEIAQTSDKVFVEVSAEPTAALVQSQIVYTVRLYRATQLTDLKLAPPETDGPYTVVEQLGNSRESEKTVNGIRYRVSELHYALFPQTPGVLTVKPANFTALEVDKSRGGYNPFAFAPTPSGKRVSVRSEPLQITIKPIPSGAPSKPWLPATSLQLAEAWPTKEPEFRVGEPITRTLMVVAQGLPAAKLPALAPQYPSGVKTYSENATLENRPSELGLTGVRQERTTIVPTEDGRFRLPAIQVRWWNTGLNRAESTQLPARSIRVLPAVPGTSTAPTQPPVATYQQQYPLMAPPTAPWSAMNEPPLEPEPVVTASGSEPPGEPARLVWVSLLLGMGWLGTAAAWWLSHRRGAGPAPAAPRPSPARHAKPKPLPLPPALQALRTACEHDDRHGAQDALLAWGRQTWPDQAVTSLGVLAVLTGPPLREEIQALDRSLYGAQGGLWSAQRLWDALRTFRPPQSDQPVIPDEMLTPLNPVV